MSLQTLQASKIAHGWGDRDFPADGLTQPGQRGGHGLCATVSSSQAGG
jgi:hypothetical protein